jgi:hypothetical protein
MPRTRIRGISGWTDRNVVIDITLMRNIAVGRLTRVFGRIFPTKSFKMEGSWGNDSCVEFLFLQESSGFCEKGTTLKHQSLCNLLKTFSWYEIVQLQIWI